MGKHAIASQIAKRAQRYNERKCDSFGHQGTRVVLRIGTMSCSSCTRDWPWDTNCHECGENAKVMPEDAGKLSGLCAKCSFLILLEKNSR